MYSESRVYQERNFGTGFHAVRVYGRSAIFYVCFSRDVQMSLLYAKKLRIWAEKKGYNGVRTYNVLENGVKIRGKVSRSDGLPE
ncbi:hypothetical protein U1Q18_051470 [Sarracenia purpurea var. burkii]